MTPAGWYRDPYGTPGLLRWWDGREWTKETLYEDDDRPSGDPGAPGCAAEAASPPDGSGGPPSGEHAAGAANDRPAGPGERSAPEAATAAEPGTGGEPEAGGRPGPSGVGSGTEPGAETSTAPPAPGAEAAPDAGAAGADSPGDSGADSGVPAADALYDAGAASEPGAVAAGTEPDARTRPVIEPPADADAGMASQAGAEPGTAADAGTGAGSEARPGAETQAWPPPGSGQTWPGPGQGPWPPAPGQAPTGWAPAGAPSAEQAPGAWPPPGQGQGAWPQPGQAPSGTWQQAGQGGWPPPGQVPPPWQYPEPAWGTPPGGRRGLRALLIGGGVVLVLIIAVVIALIASGVGGNTDKSGHSPVTATINDTKAGISYAGLGGAWHRESVGSTGGLARLGFDQGEDAVVMKNYDNGNPYVASAYSGVVPSQAAGSLDTTATALLAVLEPLAYPPHTRQVLSSTAHTVDGHDGWLLEVRFRFPEAKARGWNFRSETAAIMVIDRGNGQPPAEFYVSIPDSHKKQGDLDLLLSSLKVS